LPVEFLLSPLSVIEQKEDGKSDDRVDRGTDKLVDPQNVELGQAEKPAVDQEQQEAVEQEKSEIDEDAGREVFYIDLDTNAGGDVADDRLRHAVDPNGLIGQSVLEQANGSSSKGAGDGITPRDREENSNDKWKIEDREARKRPRQQGLQQDRSQWHQKRDGRRKAVLLEFPTGCIAASGHKDRVRGSYFALALKVRRRLRCGVWLCGNWGFGFASLFR